MKDLFLLLSTKIKILLFLSVPLGIMVGLIEILFAISLNDLLISTNLIAGTIKLNFFEPIILIFIVGIFRFLFLFFSQLTTNSIFELLNKQIREITINYNYNFGKEIGLIKSQKLLNIISAKVAEFLHSCSNLTIQIFIFFIIYLNLLNMSIQLSIYTSIIFFLLGSPLIIIKKKISLFSNDFQNRLNFVTEKIFKDIRNLNFFRIIGSLNYEKKIILEKNKLTIEPFKKYLLAISFLNQTPQLIGIIIITLIITFNNKYLFIDKSLLVPFLYLILRSIISFGNIVNEFGRIIFTKSFVSRLKDITKLNYNQKIVLNKKNLKINNFNLKVVNLSIGYEKTIKSNINFSIKEKTFNLFHGKSGIGKTALLMSIMGLLKKKSGQIFWDNISLNRVNLIDFRKNVSYCTTDPFLIEGSISENLKYGLNDYTLNKKDLINALKICQCNFLFKNGKYDLNLKLDNEGSGLSSGQRQRISLARGLLKKPRLLILDEATVNVDEKIEFKIINTIKKQYKYCTILAISHRKSLKQFADQIIDLSN